MNNNFIYFLVFFENVVIIGVGVCVIEGVSRSRNVLINGDIRYYDWDSGYICY